ncbi:nucleotidyltransferase [Prevotella sp. P5-92]|uniref:nucleotidyltransferase family protein n=1 Tax=Prevotella sp. P5-92 TaxID=2024222 RepID=UPI000B96AFC8|nr:nucleotidyltransferase domain-containing protein [Prevotella sp. P5-92]OYP54950.1 nucleotidyltransferase [Prevotella sp. P5-92]
METGTLDTIRQYFATQPIKKAWLFGSCSRGEDTPDSDIDILVEYNDSNSISLMTISRIMTSLSKKLKRKIDLVETGCLLPFAEMSVEKDKKLIYERKD